MKDASVPLQRLIEHLERLPGIGRKSAQRLAFHFLDMPQEKALDFANCIIEAKEKIHRCERCQNFTDASLCVVCAHPSRDSTVICVVESPRDVMAFERTKEYRGTYHAQYGHDQR